MNKIIERQLHKHRTYLLAGGLLIGAPAIYAADSTTTTPVSSGVTTYSYSKTGVKSTTLTPPPMPAAPKTGDAKTTTTTTTTTTHAGEEAAIVKQTKPIVSANPKVWQVFRETFNLQAGQNTMPLTLKVTNGEGGKSEFQAIQVNMNGSKFADQKDFKGPSLAKGLGGLTPGANQVIFQAYGPVGAKLTWKIVTSKFSADSVDPLEIGPADVASVKGRGFTQASTVTVGGKQAKITSASATLIKFTVAEGTPGGKQDLLVTAGGVSSKAIKVTVKIPPEVAGVNFVSTAPGQPITISGKNFSTTASENEVIFTTPPPSNQTLTTTATSASATAIDCVVPNMDFPVWNVSIKVKTNGVECKSSSVTINVQQRVIPNDGVPEQ